MRRRWSALVLVLAVAAGACTGGSTEVAELRLVEGAVQVEGPDGWQPADRVLAGERVRADETSLLRNGPDEITLLAGSDVVVGPQRLQVASGDVTVRGAVTSIALDETIVDVLGVVRVQAGVAPRIAVYSGTADVGRPGEAQQVQELRELTLTGQRFDGTDEPLRYDEADPVDREHLMPAIAFDREVARYVTTLADQYGRAPQPTTFYATFTDLSDDEAFALVQAAPVREGELVGPPSEALVGLFVARAIASSADLSVTQAAAQVADLRRQGARWGLIAMALRLEQVVFAATVDTAVAVRDDFVAGVAQAARPQGRPGAARPSVTTSVTAPAPPSAGQPAPPPGGGDPGPPPEEDPGPVAVPEGVEALIDEVLGIGPVDLSTSGLGGVGRVVDELVDLGGLLDG